MIGETTVGVPLLLRHVGAVAASCLLLLMHAAIGAAVLRVVSVAGTRSASWRWPVTVSLGGGLLATLYLAMGAIGLLQPLAVLLALVPLLVWARRDLQSILTELRTSLGGLRGREFSSAHLPWALVLGFALLLLAGALAPPTEWDSLMYHLRVPMQFLEEGRVFLPRDNFHVALVGVAQMATLPLLAVGIVTGPALMQAAALLLLLVATHGIARGAGLSRVSSALTFAVLVGCPILLLVGISARVDVTLTLLLLSAHLGLLDAVEASDARTRRALLLVAAVLIGFAVGIKPQGGAYAIALIPLGWRAAGSWRAAAAAVALALLAYAPWGIKNQVMVGSIVYPAAPPQWFQPWLAEVYGGKVPPATVDHSALEVLGEARQSFNILDAFWRPVNITIEGEGYLYRTSPALLLLPLSVFGWRNRRVRSLSLVAVAYTLVVIVPFGRINLRYLIPALPGLAVGVAAAVDALLGTRSRFVHRAGTAAVSALALLPMAPVLRERFVTSPVLLQHAVGSVSAMEVWERHPDFTVWQFAPVIQGVQAHVPEEGLVLLLFEARGFAFERPVLADILLTNWSYVSQSPAADACLVGTGITHVLISTGSISYYAARGSDLGKLAIPALPAFVQRCLGERVMRFDWSELWTLRDTPRTD